jgi:16S rRNA G966 N2-methylase RsmD
MIIAADAVHWLQHMSMVEQLQDIYQDPPYSAGLLLPLLLCRPHDHSIWRQHL